MSLTQTITSTFSGSNPTLVLKAHAPSPRTEMEKDELCKQLKELYAIEIEEKKSDQKKEVRNRRKAVAAVKAYHMLHEKDDNVTVQNADGEDVTFRNKQDLLQIFYPNYDPNNPTFTAQMKSAVVWHLLWVAAQAREDVDEVKEALNMASLSALEGLNPILMSSFPKNYCFWKERLLTEWEKWILEGEGKKTIEEVISVFQEIVKNQGKKTTPSKTDVGMAMANWKRQKELDKQKSSSMQTLQLFDPFPQKSLQLSEDESKEFASINSKRTASLEVRWSVAEYCSWKQQTQVQNNVKVSNLSHTFCDINFILGVIGQPTSAWSIQT